jgi:hypothetical protein
MTITTARVKRTPMVVGMGPGKGRDDRMGTGMGRRLRTGRGMRRGRGREIVKGRAL